MTASPSPLAQLWHHLTSVWGALGCSIDPNGAKCSSTTTPASITATTPTDLGCGIDPDGIR